MLSLSKHEPLGTPGGRPRSRRVPRGCDTGAGASNPPPAPSRGRQCPPDGTIPIVPLMRWPGWSRSEPDLAAREDAAQRRERAVAMGKRLRDQRVRSGLSIVDVERDTRINRVYLEALEEAHFDVLPAPIYARGFVRSYA